MPVVTLKHPVELNGRKYEALTLRRARAGDLRLLDQSGLLDLFQTVAAGAAENTGAGSLPPGLLDKCVPFLARLTDVDEAVIDALDAEDFLALFGRLQEVMPSGPLQQAPPSTR